MAIRKNTRRFDPRYFMDEKTDKKVIKVDEKTEKKVLKEVMPRHTQLPDEPDLLQYADEQRMDQISKELEKQFVHHTIVTVEVPDFDGSMVDLDTFLTKMGNYVVTGDVSMKQAKVYIDQIVDNLTVDRDVLNYWSDPRDYEDDPDYSLQEVKPGGGEYQDPYSGDYSSRSRAGTDLNEKFDTVVDALGQIGEIAHGAVSAVQTEND